MACAGDLLTIMVSLIVLTLCRPMELSVKFDQVRYDNDIVRGHMILFPNDIIFLSKVRL